MCCCCSHEAKLRTKLSEEASALARKRWRLGGRAARIAPDPFTAAASQSFPNSRDEGGGGAVQQNQQSEAEEVTPEVVAPMTAVPEAAAVGATAPEAVRPWA